MGGVVPCSSCLMCTTHRCSSFLAVYEHNWSTGKMFLVYLQAGWTEHDYDTPVMIYPSEVSDHIADSMIQICNEPLVLGGPETAVIQASRFCLPYGRSTIGKPQVEAPLVRLVLMPCELAENASSRKSADFAVVFFTSHVLGGARTYYKLLSMLSVDHPVASLNAVRVPGVYDKVVACLGQDPTAWLRTSINFIGSSLCGIYFGRAPQLYRLVVCPEKLAKLKASSVDNSSNGEAFVSTNDIITACLGCLVGARLMHMAVDFKQRFVDIGDDCVGNYETTVQLDDRYLKTPLAVRHAVTAISDRCAALDGVEGEVGAVMGRNEPLAALPAWWQFPFTRHAKITNWVTSTKQLVLPGCQQVFHTPAGDDPIKMYKMCPFEIVIVFRMNAEQTGVVVVSKLFSKQDYVNALPVVDFRDDFV